MAYYDAYIVRRRTDDETLVVCDTMKEARQAVRRLQAQDIESDKFEPFTYEIKGVIEHDYDRDGRTYSGEFVVDIDGGLIP